MTRNLPPADDLDLVLSRLPAWQPPPGFASRVAALAVAPRRARWATLLPLLPRTLSLVACVTVGAWLGGELLRGGLLSMAAPEAAAVGWMLGAVALVLAANRIRRGAGIRA
jgi:hypothetical protein